MAKSRRTPELERIGAAIRNRRERRGQTQHEVARQAQLSYPHYNDIERGDQPSKRETYMRIARALDISPEEMDELTGQEANVA